MRRCEKKKHPESVQYELLGSLFKNMNSVVCHPWVLQHFKEEWPHKQNIVLIHNAPQSRDIWPTSWLGHVFDIVMVLVSVGKKCQTSPFWCTWKWSFVGSHIVLHFFGAYPAFSTPPYYINCFFSNILTIADMETHSKINTLNTPWVHLKRVPPMHRKNLSFWNSPNLSISVSVDERYGEFSQFLPKKVPNI